MAYTKDPRLAFRTIDSVLYIISPWDHRLHRINETGSRICTLLDQGMTTAAIARSITADFLVDPALARCDVDRFCAALSRAGLYHALP